MKGDPRRFVDFLYYNPERDSHFLLHDTRSMKKLGMTRTCFIALCVMLVSYVLEKVGNFADLQYLLVNIIVNNISFKNTILYENSKRIEGSLEKVLIDYIKEASVPEAMALVAHESEEDSEIISNELDRISKYIISMIKSLHYTITGKFSPSSKIVTGSPGVVAPRSCDENLFPGTFFNGYPLNVPIPIAITRQNNPVITGMGLYEWGIDDWGALMITCESEYMIRWYGAYGSDNIQIAFGVSEPMTLVEFYNHIDERGNFNVLDPEFDEFVKKFILRRADYVGKEGEYEKSVYDEIQIWKKSAERRQFFKMIAFTTEYGEFINVIEELSQEKGILEASKHIKIIGRGKRKSMRKKRRKARNSRKRYKE